MAIRPLLAACLVAMLSSAAAVSRAVPAKPKVPARAHAPTAGLALARRLPLQDQIAQMLMVRGYGDYLRSDNREYKTLTHYIRDLHIGGMIVANRVRNGDVINAQPYEMAAFLNHLQKM